MSNQSKREPLLHIATIGKTVGVHGDMKFYDKSDFPEQFFDGAKFFTSLKKEIILDDVDLDKELVKIQGVNSREDAKRYTNAKLYTTREETRKNCHLDEGEYFWFDLEDCNVYENGVRLGIVNEIERILETNYLHIHTDEALIEQGHAKRFLIPFVEPFKQEVDIEKKTIIVDGGMDILEAS